MDDKDGKPIEKKALTISDIQCPTCKKSNLVLRSGKKKKFWACSGYPNCKSTFQNKSGKPVLIDKATIEV